jgi:Transposase zinc-binding domain
MTPHLEASPPASVPRDPSQTVLYRVVADYLETFLASLDADPDAKGLPAYVERELYDYLQCGILAHGFLRLGCDTCKHEMLLPFSCKRRGFCPSCAGRRMAQTAAHLVECVIPWVPTRQWVVSVPIPLRYWMAAPQDLTARSVRSFAPQSVSITSTKQSNVVAAGYDPLVDDASEPRMAPRSLSRILTCACRRGSLSALLAIRAAASPRCCRS